MLQQKAKVHLGNLKKRVISAFMAIHPSQPSDIGSHFYARHPSPNSGEGSLRQDSSARQSASELDIQDSGQSKRRKPLIIDQFIVRKPEKAVLKPEMPSGKVMPSNALTFQQQKALKTYSDNQASSYLLDQEIEVVHRFDRYA
jgi:hypothetical protein